MEFMNYISSQSKVAGKQAEARRRNNTLRCPQKNGQDCNRMALWRIPTMGAEGESRSVICESLRQKDSVKDTKEKRAYRRCFCISNG